MHTSVVSVCAPDHFGARDTLIALN